MMTSSEWLGLLEEEAALGGPKVPSAARGAAYLESQMGTTDWQKEGLRDMAGITNVQMSVSGGRKETKYFISAKYILKTRGDAQQFTGQTEFPY